MRIPVVTGQIRFAISLLLALCLFQASFQLAYAASTSKIFTLQSTSFKHNASIPAKYTCQGKNISPALSWQGAPRRTQSFVLILDDPDAGKDAWTHWLIYNIPSNVHSLLENITNLPEGSKAAKNSWGKTSYDGPCPPHGNHRYFFKLYALDTMLSPSLKDQSQIESAMQGHILATAELMGQYQK